MPAYNTRLRTNSLILPPRRLRPDPSPPPRHRLKSKDTHKDFPPPHVVLHPDDAASKTLVAIARAMLAVDNRALTIKDLSQLTLDCGLLCQNASAASQAITTFIRNHLSRCHRDRAAPLLLSLPLTGTAADDRLAPALHSRSGGTSSSKEPDRALTSFRRGTTVWYLSEVAGAPCPFKRAGICLDHITGAATATKRKRESRNLPPRKLLSSPGPAMATRTRTHANANANATTARLRVKLTLRLSDPPPPHSSSESDLTSETDSDSEPDVPSITAPESIIQQPVPVFSPDLPPYPILSASIPSPSCTTPATSLASPSVTFADPFSPHVRGSALCSSPFMNTSFSNFRTALSNPPQDHRARSRSLPFSAASPPPDSEDEDQDYHNSMVGLRRGSAPLPFKKEEEEEGDVPIAKFEPATVPASAMDDWEAEDMPSRHGVSTPLELLPGFAPFEPGPEASRRGSVKAEPTSAVLPPPDATVFRWDDVDVKPEHPSDDEQTVLDPDEVHTHLAGGKGTREDPVRIDTVVGDVEVLGPESLRSREWDAAWCSVEAVRQDDDDVMDVDVERSRTSSPEQDVFGRREADLRASPADTLATVPTAISSPPSDELIMPIEGDREAPFLMHPLRSCDPPVVATVVEGIPVYHTLLAPGVPLLRRIDTSLVNVTPLMAFLGLPLSALISHTHATPRISVSRAPEPLGGTWVPLSVAQGFARHVGPRQVLPGVRDVFLSADLGVWFPDALGRLVQLHARSAEAAGIRVEDVFAGEPRPDADVPLEPLRMSSLVFESARAAYAPVPLLRPLDEQEETFFRSYVYLESGAPASASSSSSSPSSLVTKPPASVPVVTASANDKENAGKEGAPRRKREKTVELPVRRSKRTIAAKLSAAPVTRSRSRGTCPDGRALA